MAIEFVRPKDLPPASEVNENDSIPVDDGTAVGRATPKEIVDAGRPVASQSEALEGVKTDVAMTPLTTMQVITADGAGVKAGAEAARDAAEGYRDEAEGFRDSASGYAAAAGNAAGNAAGSAAEAQTYRNQTNTYRDAALNSANSAGQFSSDAEDARDKAQAWAESPTAPGGPGTKSAKTWAEEAADSAADAEESAASLDALSFETRTSFVAAQTGVARWKDGVVVYADGIAYRRKEGSSVIPDLPGWTPEGFLYTLSHFGAVPGESGAQEFLEMAAAASPKEDVAVIDLENKNWVFSSNAIIERDRIHIVGEGASVKYAPGGIFDTGKALITIEVPDVPPEINSGSVVTSDIVEDVRDITVSDTSSFKQGEFVRIKSGLSNLDGEPFYGVPGSGGFSQVSRMEIAQVLSVVDSTTLRLTAPVSMSYDATNYTVYVDPFDFGEDVVVEGINFIGEGGGEGFPASGNPASPHGISISGVRGARLLNCSFSNFPRHHASIRWCWDVIVSANSLKGINLSEPESVDSDEHSPWFTGVNFESCTNIVFSSNTTSNMRRPCDFQGGGTNPHCRNVLVTGNVSYNCVDVQGAHKVDRVLYEGNFGYGCVRGIYYRGRNLIFRNNHCELKPGARAIGIGDGTLTAGVAYDVDYPLDAGDVYIEGNTFKGQCELYFYANCDISRLRMRGNTFTGQTATLGFRPVGLMFLSRRLRNIEISDNIIDCSKVPGPLRVIDLSRRGFENQQVFENVYIEGNLIKGGTEGVRITAPHPDYMEGPGARNVIIKNNTFESNSERNIRLYTGADNIYARKVVIANNIGLDAPSIGNISGSASYYIEQNNIWNVEDIT